MSLVLHTQVPAAANAPVLTTSNERELELIRRIVAQDRAALKELYLTYHRRLARFLTRVTWRHDVVEEIINDTMFTVWTSAPRFRFESRVSTWIVGIAYRRALKSMRKLNHEWVDLAALEGELSTDGASDREDREWIERALADLPREQRVCLELAYVLGHSCEEIAQIMSCSVNTVKTRMFHGRRKLKISLPRLAGLDG